MNRRQFVIAGTLLSATPAWAAGNRFEQGLLWRLSKQGVAPSHVFGTIHVPDPRLSRLLSEVIPVFDAAKSLMVENLPDGYSKERFLEAAMFLDQRTLEQTIGAEDFERALKFLRPIGLTREFINKLKPWGVLINLRGDSGGQDAALDAQLVERARARRIPSYQIEEVEEQIFTFDEIPMETQVALLRHSLGHGAELQELASRTLDAYLARDLSRIWRLRQAFIARHPQISAHQAIMTKRVVHDRSVVMAFRMGRQLRRGGAFVALGALHLHGPKGVLALLDDDGFQATRVY